MKTKFPGSSLVVYYPYLYVVVFLGSLCLPFITRLGGEVSMVDDFKGKVRLVNLYTEFRLALGDRVYNRSVVSENGWINLTDGYAMSGYQNVAPLMPAELQEIYGSLAFFRDQLESDGRTLLVVIAPDKQSIYPEYVPVEIPRQTQPSRLDQLMGYFGEVDDSFPLLDLRPGLIAAKAQYPVYYATDTHWNPIGAFIGYQTIMRSLQVEFPALQPNSLSEYEIVAESPILFNFAQIAGSATLVEAPITLVPLFPARATEFSLEVPSPNGSLQIHYAHTDDLTAPSALVFTDSFFTALRPFVSEHFARTVYVNHTAAVEKSYQAWIEQIAPDIVIFEITERDLGGIAWLLSH